MKKQDESRKRAAMTPGDGYICIGATALRDPVTRAFLPSVPLYIRAEDAEPGAMEKLLGDAGALFADKMKQYMDGCAAAGHEI